MFVDRLFEGRSRSVGISLADPAEWLIELFGGQETSSGEKVSEANALIHPDVFICVQILADDIAKLPIQVFQKKNGRINKIENHQVAKLLADKPNEYMTAFTWKKLMMTHLGIHGNAYSYIKFDKNGNVKGLYPLHPSYTQPFIDPNSGMLWYETLINNQTVELYPDEILHYKGMTDDGILGKSPVQVLRELIGAQAAATKFNAKFYRNDATPRGILKVPTVLKPEAKRAVREEWKRVNSNENIAVVDAGLDYESISMSPQDAQFIESMKFNRLQIAALYKIPPHKINDLDRGTYNNVEQQSLDYLKNTLLPWFVAIEQENDIKLFTDSEINAGFYTKFNAEAELRADSKSRAEFYQIMVDRGIYSINEVRELEEKNPVDGADDPRVDLNHVSIKIADQYQLAKAGALKGGDDNGSGDQTDNNADRATSGQ